jgi:hypothetical protein
MTKGRCVICSAVKTKRLVRLFHRNSAQASFFALSTLVRVTNESLSQLVSSDGSKKKTSNLNLRSATSTSTSFVERVPKVRKQSQLRVQGQFGPVKKSQLRSVTATVPPFFLQKAESKTGEKKKRKEEKEHVGGQRGGMKSFLFHERARDLNLLTCFFFSFPLR